jgi:hypothetical protein
VVRGPCFAVDREPAHARASGMGVRRPAKTREHGDRVWSTWSAVGGSSGLEGAGTEVVAQLRHSVARLALVRDLLAEPTPDRTQGKSVSCRSIRSGLAKVRPGNLGRTPKVPSRRSNLAGMWPETATKCPSGEARSPDGSGPFDLRAHRWPSVLLGRRRRSDDAS